MWVERDGMTFNEAVYDHPDEIHFYGDVIKTFRAVEPFEVDGIIYDPTNVLSGARRPMIDLLSDSGY